MNKNRLLAVWFLLAIPTSVLITGRSVARDSQDIASSLATGNTADSNLPSCCSVENNQTQAVRTAAPSKPAPSNQGNDEANLAQTARASQWTNLADREAFDLDFTVTNQIGRSHALSELVGQPMAVSFIFTRCPNLNLCPLITLTMTQLQKDLEAAGLAQRVKLVLMTYDPVYDTPQRLQQYGLDHGLRFTNATMLQPDADEFGRFLEEFQVGVSYRPDGSIGHFVELLIVDHQGKFVRDYQGNVWDNTAVLDDLKRLVEEQHAISHDG